MDKKTKNTDIIKVSPKGVDPKKYVDTEPTYNPNSMQEAKSNTVVITFGRFSPPTIGHEKLVNKIKEEAKNRRADALIYASHTYDKKKNPLDYQHKISFLTTAFGNIVKNSNAKTIIEVAKELDDVYDNLVVIVGQDRVAEFNRLLNAYNGKEYNFDDIKIISAGDRDPDADDVSGMSASKLRSLAVAKDLESFKNGLPKRLQSRATEVYNTVLKGMGLMEDIGNEDNNLEEKVVPLTFAQRVNRSRVMKRYHRKIEAARERARKRRASPEKLADRSRKKALILLRTRLSKSKSYSEMTPSEKLMLDKRLSSIPQAVINRIATKQLPIVRKAEAERMSAMHRNEAADVDERFEMFLENFTQESSINEKNYVGLVYKKRFHNLYKKEGKVNHDLRFKIYKPKKNIFEDVEELNSELFDLIESLDIFIEESKLEKDNDDPCWSGYAQLGTKKKGNRVVPNCVPIKEGQAVDMTKSSIEREKESDKDKHKNMLDNARKIDSRRKSLKTESSDIIKKIVEREMKHRAIAKALKSFSDVADKADSKDHLDHADKIIKTHGAAVSSADLVKLYHRIKNSKHYEKSYSAFDAWESVQVDKANPNNRQYGTDSLVKILKSDTPGEELDEANGKFIPPIKHSKSMVKDFVEPLTPDLSVVVSKHNKHHLGIGLDLKQMIKHAMVDKDLDNDGDVDAADKKVVGDGELVADPSFDKTKTPGEATSKMKKKYEKEMKHTKPGVAFESVDESFGRSFGSWSDEMNKTSKKAKADAEEKSKKRGPVTSDTLKDINDKLGNNKKNSSITKEEANVDERFESFMEGKTRGFEGDMIDVPNVKIRTIDGKLKSFPVGKSSSSKGGDGE